jgi:hypothetical protein
MWKRAAFTIDVVRLKASSNSVLNNSGETKQGIRALR